MSTPRYFQHVLVTPAIFTLGDAYAELVGTELDALRHGSKWIAYNIVESNNKGATVKVQGSIDGVTWNDLRVQDNTGAAYSSVDISVAGNGAAQAFINDDSVTNSPDILGGYRFYRLQGKNTSGGNVAAVTIVGVLK